MARGKEEVLVVGLGRFGSALAKTLMDLGRAVLAVDLDADRVDAFAEQVTHVVEADSTNVKALRQLGAGDFRRAVVAIGTDIEASILTTSALVDVGVDEIWAKAVTDAHGRILERVGADHVVYPEGDMGERLAHIVTGRMIDYVELDENFALVETNPPAELVGHKLGEFGVRRRFGITVVCIKPVGGSFTYATADTVVGPEDLLVIAGERRSVESFAELD